MPRCPPRPTYEELLARIAALEAEIDRLRADLAAARGEDEPPATGGGEVIAATAPVPTKKGRPAGVKANVVRLVRHRPRRPRAPVPGRRREVADRVVVHAPAVCGGCGAALTGGRLVGRRQVVEVPPVKAEVVEHQARERRCRCCGWVGRGELPDLGARAGRHRRLGWSVAAWAAALRTELRLPLRQVRWLLDRAFGVRLSTGSLSGLLDETARAGRGAYDALLAEARASPVVHIDETHWREDGQNGYVWTVSTPTVRLFHYTKSRAGAARATAEQARPIFRERVADRFAAALVNVCRGQPASSPQATLFARIARYRTDLFPFAANPAVPPTNNAAERALRPLVVARKVSGGTRSKRGSQSRMILQSLVATWDLRGLDPVTEFLALLTTPRQPTSGIAPL